MSIVYQSSQSNTVIGTSLTITKPVGTAVGDLLVAVIAPQNTMTTAPSGWTQVATDNSSSNNLYVYTVIATSTQTAASDFTWTSSSNCIAGGIARFTGDFHTTLTAQQAQDDDTSTTTPTYVASVTPDNANSMMLFCVGAGSSGAGTTTASNYAVATDNPSWAESFDVGVDSGGGGNVNVMLAYAERAAVSATGNATLAFAGARESCAIIISLRPQVVAPITENVSANDTATRGVGKVITENVGVNDLDTLVNDEWTQQSKNTSIWTPQDKS